MTLPSVCRLSIRRRLTAAGLVGLCAWVAVLTHPAHRFWPRPLPTVTVLMLWAAGLAFYMAARTLVRGHALAATGVYVFYACELAPCTAASLPDWLGLVAVPVAVSLGIAQPAGSGGFRNAAVAALCGAGAALTPALPTFGVAYALSACAVRRRRGLRCPPAGLAALLGLGVGAALFGLRFRLIWAPVRCMGPSIQSVRAHVTWLISGFVDPGRALLFWGTLLTLGAWAAHSAVRAYLTGRSLVGVLLRSDLGLRPWLLLSAWTPVLLGLGAAMGGPDADRYGPLLTPGALCTALGLRAVLRWPRGRCSRARWVAAGVGVLAAAGVTWFMFARTGP